jgi:DNA-binding response OmpR family regulator
MKAKILLVEGKRAERPSFFGGLMKKGFEVISVSSGRKALTYLEKNQPDVVLVDATSMRTSGKRICRSIRQNIPDIPLLLIIDQPVESEEELAVDAVLTEPFTVQKLSNRIKPLLPSEGDHILKAGPVYLDLDRNLVRCNENKAQLTPRLVILLRILMENPGEIIEREELFKKVWDTGYTGDTRTLDVHISWLRHAIEEDPRRPRYIKTIRGVGYRLDTE